MTTALAAAVAVEAGFVSQIAEAERQVRSFLVTATRYVASGRNPVALRHLEAAAEDPCGMSADEFDRTLLRIWKNPGK